MVSNIRFYSFKDVNLKKSVPFVALLLIVLFIVLVSSYPPGMLFGLFILYALSGYVLAAWGWLKGRRPPAQP